MRRLSIGRPDPTMAAPCPLLGDGITDDTLLTIARFLPTTRDVVSLQLACPRFAAKVIAAPGGAGGCSGSGGDAVDPVGRSWILMKIFRDELKAGQCRLGHHPVPFPPR